MSTAPLPTVVVRRARPDDRAAVEKLLLGAGLPLAGVAEHLPAYLVGAMAGGIVGAIGMEYYGASALLRSAVVEPGSRGRGIGDLLVARALEEARRRGSSSVYLLTETAAPFFARLGFRPVPRGSLPAELGESAELRGACPESAVAMVREVAGAAAGS